MTRPVVVDTVGLGHNRLSPIIGFPALTGPPQRPTIPTGGLPSGVNPTRTMAPASWTGAKGPTFLGGGTARSTDHNPTPITVRGDIHVPPPAAAEDCYLPGNFAADYRPINAAKLIPAGSDVTFNLHTASPFLRASILETSSVASTSRSAARLIRRRRGGIRRRRADADLNRLHQPHGHRCATRDADLLTARVPTSHTPCRRHASRGANRCALPTARNRADGRTRPAPTFTASCLTCSCAVRVISAVRIV
jgi:hypothetical protein